MRARTIPPSMLKHLAALPTRQRRVTLEAMDAAELQGLAGRQPVGPAQRALIAHIRDEQDRRQAGGLDVDPHNAKVTGGRDGV